MIVSGVLLNSMLDGVFNKGGETYRVYLQYNGVDISGRPPVDIAFNNASNGIVLSTASIIFTGIPSGTNVNGIRVNAINENFNIIIETFATINYTANGTLTVNSISITVTTT